MSRAWIDEGTERFVALVGDLTDTQLRQPCLLPDWTRAHLIGHVSRNADALRRLLTWARTGVETPMYADATQRAAEIERTAVLPGAELRRDLLDTATSLSAEIESLDERDWTATVRTAQGRTVPATEVLWLRTREVWLHAVDLGTGDHPRQWPPDLVDRLLGDVVGRLSTVGAPPVSIVLTDRADQVLSIGAGPEVSGTAADVTAWLTGRGPALGPAMPPWL